MKSGKQTKPKVVVASGTGNRAVAKGSLKAMPILGFGAFRDDDEKPLAPPITSPSPSHQTANRGLVSTGGGGFSKEEIDVLR